MALRHYNLTLTGVAQRLSDVLTPVVAQAGEQADVALRVITLQMDDGSTNPLFVASDNGVSATDYAFRLEGGAGGVPPAPFILGEFEQGPIRLSDFYVVGTATEVLHIGTVPY